MKKSLLFLYSTLFLISSTLYPLWGQGGTDSVHITHTQETGTLEKQRFIDKYDYVFMTKEPTKWMLKGYENLHNASSSNIFDIDYLKSFLDFRLGIEHKLTPSFSVELDITYNHINPFSGDNGGGLFFNVLGNRLITSIESRWYYDMANRIRQGKSRNNFSGNYLSLKYENVWANNKYLGLELSKMQNGGWQNEYYANYYKSQISFNYGAQRRFFRYGLIDFSIGLNLNTNQKIHKKLSFSNTTDPIIDAQTTTTINETFPSITTDIKIGVALADFKKTARLPAYDIFQSFIDEPSIWKIDWPRIRISPHLQLLSGAIGFEQKILKSPFSVSTYLSFDLHSSNLKNLLVYDIPTQQIVRTDQKNTSVSATFSVQPRWYLLMNRQIKRGVSGNNLAGVYIGANNTFYGSYRMLLNYKGRLDDSIKPSFMNTGLLLGYQKKLFNHGFFDFNVTRMLLNRPTYLFLLNDFLLDFKLGFAL